jgi:XTP/dITP diphosphohydrolase
MWFDMGSPKNLFIEIGGVLSDPEVEPLFAPIIQRMSASIGAKTILLSETSYNGEFIKTKAVQDGVKELSAHQITPWLIVAREPEEFKDSTASEHIEFERVLSDKLYQNTNIRFGRVFSVPFYKDLTAYTNFINQRFLPLITPSNEDDEIVIATSNDSKYADYLLYLGDNNKLVQGSTLPYKIDIPEGTNSVEDNAIAKARAASIMTNRIAIGDDIGFFIEELYGEPGVALRRWGGELGDSATNANFWEHLQKKTKKLVSLKCYFEQCVAIVSPRGDIKLVYNYNHGTLNRNKLKLPYNNSGYPLGAAFESTDRNKTWDEMSNEEKKVSDKTFIDKLRSAIDDMKNL